MLFHIGAAYNCFIFHDKKMINRAIIWVRN